MDGAAASVWEWAGPALIVFTSAAVLAFGLGWALRRRGRSPAARAAAEAERSAAGAALVQLDDAIAELDLEVGLSGALYDGTAPAALRRVRMSAQHTRDAAFEEYLALTPTVHPRDVRRVAARIHGRVDAALASIAHARRQHAEWMHENVSAATQVEAARARLRALGAELGDPGALLAGLAERFDRSEWTEAEQCAALAVAALSSAEEFVDQAADLALDPTRSALPVLADAERALRAGQDASRRLEERYRLVMDAANAVDGELNATREVLRQAIILREGLEPASAARLGDALHEIDADISRLQDGSSRRPTETVAAVVRLRDRLDLAVGDARTAAQRLRGARSALPGTLAVAREAIARAEPRVVGAGADARSRLAAAHREMAAARGADDPVDALDAARRALRNAEDAVALSDYDVISGSPSMTGEGQSGE